MPVTTQDLLRRLRDLSEVDHQLVVTREQLGQYPAMLARMRQAEAEQARRTQALDAELKEIAAESRALDKDLATAQERIRKYLDQQSAVKTNKEYEAITHEIEQQRAKMDELETRGLALLEREDAANARLAKVRQSLARLTAEHDLERARIKEQSEEKETRLARLARERETRFGELPADWHDPYELLNEHFPGTACVPIEGESCGGCHWHLVAHIIQRVHLGRELMRCDHCRRVLFNPEAGQ